MYVSGHMYTYSIRLSNNIIQSDMTRIRMWLVTMLAKYKDNRYALAYVVAPIINWGDFYLFSLLQYYVVLYKQYTVEPRACQC